MDRRYLILAILLPVMLFATGCIDTSDMEGEDDDQSPNLSKSYNGTLTLTYSKTFPAFTATTTMSVKVQKSGEITIGSAPPASWDADEVKAVEDDQIRQKDSGSLSITQGSSVTILRGTDEFVALDVHVTFTGEQETFAWDDEHKTWFSVANIPYTVEDPMSPPLEFSVAEAADPFSGAVMTHTAPQALDSTVTYTWKLFLIPGLDQGG